MRTFSIRAGLAASTVTPGRTPPDGSRTTPTMLLCAEAAAGSSRSADAMTRRAILLMPIDRSFQEIVSDCLGLHVVEAPAADRSRLRRHRPSRLQAPGPAADMKRNRKQLRMAASWFGSTKLPQKRSGQ